MWTLQEAFLRHDAHIISREAMLVPRLTGGVPTYYHTFLRTSGRFNSVLTLEKRLGWDIKQPFAHRERI